LGDDPGDPEGGVGRDQPQRRAPIGAEQVEEPVQRRVVAAGVDPQQPAGVMVDHHRQRSEVADFAVEVGL
jgi:hypothetical protein